MTRYLEASFFEVRAARALRARGSTDWTFSYWPACSRCSCPSLRCQRCPPLNSRPRPLTALPPTPALGSEGRRSSDTLRLQ